MERRDMRRFVWAKPMRSGERCGRKDGGMNNDIKCGAVFGVAATLLSCLLLALSAQAASFDCGKAQTKVEHLICDNPEISVLDDEMAKLYSEIRRASSNDLVLKNTQRDWLKYRQTCFAPEYKQKESICLSNIYRRHNNILRGSLPTELGANKAASLLCVHIASLVEEGKAFDLEPKDWESNSPGSKLYKFDIDEDGVADSLEIECGSGECGVEIKLSYAKSYDLNSLDDGYGFYLIRYQSSIYALVSYSEDRESQIPMSHAKHHLGRLHLIAPTGAKLVCGKRP